MAAIGDGVRRSSERLRGHLATVEVGHELLRRVPPAVQVGVDLFEREQLEQDLGGARRAHADPNGDGTRATELRATAQAGMTSPERECVERDTDLLSCPLPIASRHRDRHVGCPGSVVRDRGTDREEDLTGDVARQVGREPGHEGCDVAGIARIEFGVLVRFEWRLVGSLGHGDQPGRARRGYAVGSYAVALHLESERDREHCDTALGGCVVRLSDVALEADERARTDDRSVHRAADLLRVVAPIRARVPARREMPPEVDLDDGVPVVLVHVEDHPVAQDARVVHEDVETPEGVDRLLHHVAGAREVGDVVEVGDRLAAAGTDDRGNVVGRRGIGTFPSCRSAEVVHHDARAGGCEVQRMSSADAVAGTGDDGDLSVQDAHDDSPSLRWCHTRASLQQPQKCSHVPVAVHLTSSGH